MQRKLMSVLVAAALFIAAPQAVYGQLYLGPEVAWNNDYDIGIGAGVEFGLNNLTEGLGLYGDFLYFFADDAEIASGSETILREQDYFEFNANLTYVFPLKNSSVTPFALAGANFGIRDVNTENISFSGDDDLQVGLNLGGGIQFNLGDFRPRAGARFVLGGYETFTVFGFLPFAIGG